MVPDTFFSYSWLIQRGVIGDIQTDRFHRDRPKTDIAARHQAQPRPALLAQQPNADGWNMDIREIAAEIIADIRRLRR